MSSSRNPPPSPAPWQLPQCSARRIQTTEFVWPLVGLGGRSNAHGQSLIELEQEGSQAIEFAGVCDCDQAKLNTAARVWSERAGHKVTAYDDMRRVLDDPTIDAVTFATPNHWHALEGHMSSALCHLANIAYRVDHTVHFDPDSETFGDDSEATALLTRPERAPYVVPQQV